MRCGDKVQIIAQGSQFEGMTGKIACQPSDRLDCWLVNLDGYTHWGSVEFLRAELKRLTAKESSHEPH